MKAYIASVWCSKELNIGITKLKQASYVNISGEVRLIDSLKFYQRSLGELSSTLTAEENKPLIKNVLNEHYCFCTVWPYLSLKQNNKILEAISEGKGIIPYKIIVNMKSFIIKPENELCEKLNFLVN